MTSRIIPGVLRDSETVAYAHARPQREAAIFALSILVASILMQRFAIPVGDKGANIVGPIGLAAVIIAFARGALSIHRQRLTLFVLLVAWVMVSSSLQAIYPSAFDVPFSFKSCTQFVLLNGFCIFSFAQPVDELAFFRGATGVLAALAVAGIIEFVLQFVGLSLFSFSAFIPTPISYEATYHVVIPVGIGLLNKSNGFFLLEPSIFSQTMAMGLMMEVLTFRRGLFIALFAIAILLAFSGTGLLVLGAFLLSVAVKVGKRGILLAFSALIVISAIVALIAYIMPEVAHVFGQRMNEFEKPGSSGYGRFHSPFIALESAWDRDKSAWLIGIGAGAASHMNLAIDYSTNLPIKILLEFGLPALVLYVAMTLCSERTRIQDALVLPSLVLLFFTGGYEEFAPGLFPVFILICVARLKPASGYLDCL